MAVSPSVISEIVFKFQLLKTQVDEMGEDLAKLKTKFALFSDTIDSVMGDFKKFDEEQTFLSGRVSDHTDRLEKIEEKVFGVAAV